MNTIGKIIQDRRKELKLRQPDITKQLEQFGYFAFLRLCHQHKLLK